MFGQDGNTPPMELVRLAIRRPVYTQSHIDYVVEAIIEGFGQRETLRGLKIVSQLPGLRHFSARFRESYRSATAPACRSGPGAPISTLCGTAVPAVCRPRRSRKIL